MFCLGSIPYSACGLPNIHTFDITASGSNPGITCAPLCVSSMAQNTVPSTTCIYNQDAGLCGFIAATNIHTISGKTMWVCVAPGVTATNPCSPLWGGLVCSGNSVVSISISGIGLSGSISWNLFL